MPVITEQFVDTAVSTLAGGAGGAGTSLNPADVTLLLQAGDGNGKPFPAASASVGFFRIVLGNPSGTFEVALCTVRTGDSCTLLRAQEGTAAGTWPVGTTVQASVTAGTFQTLYNRIAGAPYYNVRDWGAKGDGANDDTSAITAAIAAAGAAGGGKVILPAGVYKITANLQIGNGGSNVASTINGVTLVGDGIYATTIRWAGSVGGTMVTIKGLCYGNSLTDLALDGNSSAAIGCHVISGQFANWPALRIIGTTAGVGVLATALYLDTDNTFAAQADTLGNHFGKIYINLPAGINTQQSQGIWLTGQTGGGAWDTSQNTFSNVQITAQNNYTTGVRMSYCDLNSFQQLTVFQAAVTGGIGLFVDGSVVANFPNGNYIGICATEGPTTTSGTPGSNMVGWWDSVDIGHIPSYTSGLSGIAAPLAGAGNQIPLLMFGQGAPVNNVNGVTNFQLTATTGVNVAQVANPLDGTYMAHLYFRVTGGAPVTVSAAAYTGDETGTEFFIFESIKSGGGAGGAVYVALNAVSLAQGFSYSCAPIPLRWSAGQAPVVNITVSVANVVFVTAALIKIG
jgi:pectate lyase-like protein